ncbi:MAG: hypothetical protein HKM05_03915 [Spirochaetales bacterium]|nr:hypothetical protein [Spirochaetales bacterium]
MTITRLAKNRTGTRAALFLLAGKVRTEVKPAENPSDNLFVVRSPTATASVRGTGFEFDGGNLLVNHGVVVLKNKFDFSRHVWAGEFSSAGGTVVTSPIFVDNPEKPFLTATGGDDQKIPPESPRKSLLGGRPVAYRPLESCPKLRAT